MTLVHDPDIASTQALWRLGKRFGRHHYPKRCMIYRLGNVTPLQAEIASAGYAAGWAETGWWQRFLSKLKEFWRAT